MDNSNIPPTEPPGVPPVVPPPTLATPPPLRPPPTLPKSTRKRNGWRIAAIVLAILLAVSLLPLVGSLMLALMGISGPATTASGPRLEEVMVEASASHDKIVVVPVEGMIWGGSLDLGGQSMVRTIQDQLKLAARDERVKAVILKINSPGGEVLASDDINRAVTDFQKRSGKPVIAAMGSLAASGGYYAAAAARWIVANELTITGSIGVIMHGYNYRSLMNKIGLRPLVYKSGRFKDMLSGEKDLEKLSPEERADFAEEEKMVQGLIDQTYRKFKQAVEEGRRGANQANAKGKDGAGQPLAGNWAEYADGRVLSGKQAYDLGFVDELGSWEAAVKRAQQLAGISQADLVTYQPIFDFANLFRLLGKSEGATVKVDWGMDLPQLAPGHLYFLSPTYLR